MSPKRSFVWLPVLAVGTVLGVGIALGSGTASRAQEVPPSATDPVPDLSVCEAWALRKSDACRQEVSSAMMPSSTSTESPLLTPYTLYGSCALFEERRRAVGRCVETEDCAAFARCTGGIVGQRWDPREAPDLCQAFLRRKTGACRTAVREAVWAIPPDQKQARVAASYALYDRCVAEPATREAIAACMMEDCEPFAACLLDVAGSDR